MDNQNIISVAIQSPINVKLPFIPFNQLRAQQPDFDSTASGIPQKYYLKAGQLGLWPQPDSTYTIFVDYYIIPTELVSDSDITVIPLSYRECLMHYALSLEHDYNTDPDLAQKAMNRYEEMVTLARNNLLTQVNDTGNFTILGPADAKSWTGLSNEVT